MKKIIISAAILILLVSGAYLFFDRSEEQNSDQAVLEKTLEISREYAALRYRTDNVLINAKEYGDYDNWNNEVSAIIKGWGELGSDAASLEKLAGEMAEEKVSFRFVKSAQAYTKEEITKIVDKAPAGKKIRTLAQHLGVDAKMAQLILNQSQDEMSREAYGEEGDVFQKCENRAIVVKNTSKVTLFVGTIALTGGTAAIASGGTLAQAAVVVSGADLTLEVTDDAAKMALGDKNKISSVVGDARKITEPAAAILAISTLPNNLVKGIDKLNAVVFGADQLNGTIQSGSVIGIKLPTPTKEKPEPAAEVSIMEKEEVDTWMKEQGIANETATAADIEKILGIKGNDSGTEANEQTATPGGDETEESKPAATDTNNAKMPIADFNDLDESGKLKNITEVRKYFGEPDFSTVNDKGRTVYIYLDRISYESGNSGSIRFTFYTLEDYHKIAESAFGWDEDYQEIWDASGGGIKAATELKSADFFRSTYGI